MPRGSVRSGRCGLNLLPRIVAAIVCTLAVLPGAFADVTTSISTNFNSTAISSGRYLWLTAVTQSSGLGTAKVTIFVRKSSVTFTANGTTYTIQAPDTNIIYDPSGTTATVTYDTTKNQWQVYRLSSTSDFTLLSGVEFPVPSGGLPGGIKNVKWQMSLSTDTAGIGVKWMWAAAVYPTFSTNYNSLGIKPVDDQTLSQYKNTDHSGCPENYKQNVVAGGTGTGGTSCVGLYTNSVVVNPTVVAAPTAKAGGPYSGYAGQAIAFNGSGSTDPDGYPLNYSWNFGDSTTGTGATPTHAYSSAGTFTVTLTVDDGRNVKGTSTTTASITLPPPPTITTSVGPAPNASGWNNSNVTVTFTCSDAVVGIKSCTSPVTIATEGANQVVQGTAVNNGGVSSTTSVKINIDKTTPTITATASPVPDSAGWNNSNVTVTFTCADTLSGIAQCPHPVVVSTSGANQVISGTATDLAGNSATAKVTLNIEMMLPSIVASVSPGPNAQGWNNTNVTVSFTCTPTTSPITSCPQPQTISTEGAGQVVSGTVTDAAGYSNTATVTLNIAKTLPTIMAAISPQPNANGWNSSAVTVTFTCTKTTAPLATCPQPQTLNIEGANQVVTGTVTDVAGNSATVKATVNIATSLPTITTSVTPQPNASGWNNAPVTVTFNCTATTAPVTNCPQSQTVGTEGANQTITASATDAAGNTATATVPVSIDTTPPVISYSVSPTPNSNGVNTSLPVTITFTCSDALSGVATCPSAITVNTAGMNQSFSGTATDIAGNTATANTTVNVQTQVAIPPSISALASPASNARGWNNSDVTVTFACSPGSNLVASCPSPTIVSTEGANQQVCGTALDAAGLSSQACVSINLDKTPPTISATESPTPSGVWNTTSVTVTFTCSDSLSGIATCPSPQTVSTNGAGQVITGTAVDLAGNTASAQVTLNIDQTPPSILQFTAPSQLAPGQSGTVTVSATDNVSVGAVLIQLNGATIATLLAPPYTATFTVPSTANSGDVLTLTAIVSDQAGNSVSASRGVQVASSGVVAGTVLSDVTGLPLPGVTVQIVGGGGQDASDSSGRYSIPSSNSHLFLTFSMPANQSAGTPAMITVERELFLQSGVGTVPVDARLSPLAAPISINSVGGTLTSGSLTLLVAPGAVSSATNFYLTQLSEQGLPALLPLGWSPLVAFDLQTDNALSSGLNANFAQIPLSLTLHLVRYDYSSHSWIMVAPNLSSSNGTLTATIPSVGDFALVTADAGNTAIIIPAAGQPIAGVPVVPLPAGASASGSLNPPSVSPAGGTSAATLSVQSSVPLPSGTVIQAQIQETYSLTSGKQLSSAKRLEDILLYQYAAPGGAAGEATFPVAASQTFAPDVFSTGNIHLDVLSGRESVRGDVGGNAAVTVTGGDATLTVSAGSLPQDTAISVDPTGVDTFLPSSASLIPLAEYNIDFSGETLTAPAQLSVAAGAAQPGDNVFLAQIQRLNGVPYLVVVSLAQVSGANLITQAAPGLSGITQEGDYIFYKITSPTGYVSGTVTNSGNPVAAMVQTDSLPFVAFASFSGSYVIPALAGTVNVTASVPNTALGGSVSTQVTKGQTSTVNITVIGQTEAATVAPASGAVGIPLTAQIDITAPDPFNQASVTSTSVTLTQNSQGTTTQVPIRFVFSQNGTRLSVFPVSALQPSTTYTLAASGLANALGGLITVPTTTFTTQSITGPNFNTNALVFSMPDQNGNVQISAPANSFPPGTTILIVDQTNGVVLSLTVANDGSVSGTMPATIDDVLNVTITAPDKTTATFTISQYVAPDGTTAVGSGGGTVTGPGGTGIIIPQGALPKGTTFQLTQLDQTAFPALPTWQGLNFGSGVRITDPAMPTFKKEAKLVFPVPGNAPSNAFYYVYRRFKDQNGNTYFETIDHAFVQGSGINAHIETASPPFCGYHNSYGNLNVSSGGIFSALLSPFQDYFLMWDVLQTDPNLPGLASPGLIVGLAQQLVPAVLGQSAQTTQPDPNQVTISLKSNAKHVAIADGVCATFSLFDPQRGGGLRTVIATDGTTTLQAVADEVNGAQANDATYSIFAGLENQYQNIGRVNFLFPPATPPPAPPQLSIHLYTLDQNGHRVPASGILQTGTNILIAFQSKLTVTSAAVGTAQLNVETPDAADPGEILDGKPEQTLLNARVQGLFPLGASGTYTITASALDPISLTKISATQSILVVAAGGGNTTTFTCTAAPPPAAPTSGCQQPTVVNISPIIDSTGVSPSVFPQITFSEPVTNVTSSTVVLLDHTGAAVPVHLIGIRANPANGQSPVADPVQALDKITSLTIQPLNGLEYNETYTLTLNAQSSSACVDNSNPQAPIPIPQQAGTPFIVDLNTAPTGPLCLQEFPNPSDNQPYQFTTFGPQDLGGVTSQYAVMTRPAVLGNYAYAGEWINTSVGGLGAFDITDPSHPTDLGLAATVTARTIDVAGQQQSPVTGSDLVAVSAGTLVGQTIPGNVYLFSAAPPAQAGGVPRLTRVGAVSVTSSASNGLASRLFLKDQFLYASTFRQGLQVIDLGQAIAEYQQVFATNPTQVGRALTTDGDGFAMDTIVNTIQLPTPPPAGSTIGGTATMFDLKADDFASSLGGSQALLVATGQLPLVVADPTQSGPAAVLYPPSPSGTFSINPLQPLLMTSADGKTNYLFCSGRAVALASLPFTDSSGNATTKHVAVVVGSGGSGPIATATSCSAISYVGTLMVVDLSQPYSPGTPFNPQPIGFLQLPTGATDVSVYGTTALVATGGNILLVNLANPTQPQLAGQIAGNFGSWLALTQKGVVVGSAPAGSGSGSSVQTTIVGPAVLTACQSPLPATLVSGAPSLNPVYQTISPAACTIQAIGATPLPASANFVFKQTDGTVKLTVNNVPLAGGRGSVQLPAALTIAGSVALAQSTVSDPRFTSFPDTVSLGGIHLVVDSDNDTIIDAQKDTLAATNGKKFSFWQADPDNIGFTSPNAGQDGLLDFAPVRFYAGAIPDSSLGKIELVLQGGNYTANFVVTKNLAVAETATDPVASQNEMLYLTDSKTALNQLTNVWQTSVQCGAATGYSFETRLCQSAALASSNSTGVELNGVQAGQMYDLLVSVTSITCPQSPCALDGSGKLQAVLVKNDGSIQVLDEVPVDIRPLQNWMTVKTVRNGTDAKPLSYPVLESGWTDIPSSATNLVVMVHGFDVSEDDATQNFFPSWFKRLYWTGHPVLLSQNNTHTVGITWPGDPGKTDYPIAYMSAFESGIPVAKFLTDQSALNSRKIQVIAHSLGNVVVNSALSRPESQSAESQGAITTYVMNEPALPAEAFDTNYQPDAGENAIYDGGAVKYGWSDNPAQTPIDQVWQNQWAQATSSERQQWLNTLSGASYVTSPQPQYFIRWGQQRPSTGVPDNASFNSTPQRGPWKGFFAGNLSKTNIVNTYNSGDGVLLQDWAATELAQEPFIGPLGFLSDDISVQFWSTLSSTDGGQERVWGGTGCTSLGNCQHSNIIRQWAELAFWFPSRSDAAGVRPLSGIQSFNFSQYAPPPASTGLGLLLFSAPTHSYLKQSPYSRVFPAWQQISAVLK